MLFRRVAVCLVVVALSACGVTKPASSEPEHPSPTPSATAKQRAWKVTTPYFSMKVAPGWRENTAMIQKNRPTTVLDVYHNFQGWDGKDKTVSLRFSKLEHPGDLTEIAAKSHGTKVTVGGMPAVLLDQGSPEKEWMKRIYFVAKGPDMFHIQAWGTADGGSDVDYMLDSLQWTP